MILLKPGKTENTYITSLRIYKSSCIANFSQNEKKENKMIKDKIMKSYIIYVWFYENGAKEYNCNSRAKREFFYLQKLQPFIFLSYPIFPYYFALLHGLEVT